MPCIINSTATVIKYAIEPTEVQNQDYQNQSAATNLQWQAVVR